MIVFENPGELDIRAAITFGVNVKEGDSPIGLFGTGLKYAIAVLLRTGHTVTIRAGLERYDFVADQQTIRGKQFGIVTMHTADSATPLGFTTDLGKLWCVWQAYRELWCNARDEGGEVYQITGTDSAHDARDDLTQIIISGPEIDRAHETRSEFIIDGEEPLERFGDVEIYPGPSRGVFFRGMRVAEKVGSDSLDFTYNIRSAIELSEDRSAKSEHELRTAIALAVMNHASEETAAKIITSTGGEQDLDFDWSWRRPSIAFMRAVKNNKSDTLNASAEKQFMTHHYSSESLKEFAVTLGDIENAMLARSLAFLKAIGLPLDDLEMVAMANVGKGADTRDSGGKLIIDADLFQDETTLRLALIKRAVTINADATGLAPFCQVIDRLGHVVARELVAEKISSLVIK